MKRKIFVALSSMLLPAASVAQGTVYTRAWCNAPSHGRSVTGGYGWISEVFVGTSSDECWRYAAGHEQPGHHAGCSYVNPRTGEMN
jgi:hypothetical protein